mmetsp:Transcript_79347/g.157192  ORF Transcript_79347/g.157192 Transcript_79347/m.157192 type:complete len:108 (+) Transcript_79347:50-373(+)
MPVTHTVMFGWSEAATAEKVDACKEALLALPEKISSIKAIRCCNDLLISSGQNHPAGKNRSMAVIVDFDDVAGYEDYAAHPAHQEVIATHIKPIMEPGTRAAIQYES